MVDQLSKRGNINVSNIMPHIPQAILEAGWIPNEDSVIDLSMAENHMIRDEVLQIEKAVVLKREVRSVVIPSCDVCAIDHRLKSASGFSERILGKP